MIAPEPALPPRRIIRVIEHFVFRLAIPVLITR